MLSLDYKKELIGFCIQSLQQKEAELQIELDDTMKIANDYGPQKDRYDGFRNQQMRKIEMHTVQIHAVQSDIREFLQINTEHVSNSVKLGSLFSTSDQTILVATGLGKVEFKGDSIFVISPKVPFYEALKGLKQGEVGDFRGKKISINEVV